MPPTRASDLLVDVPGRRLLEQQLASDAEYVTSALMQLPLESPLCCLCFVYVADEELAAVSFVYGWTEAARNAAFDADSQRALWTLWGPADWDLNYDDIVESLPSIESAPKLTQMLLDTGCESPEGAYLMDLAYRFNRQQPLPVATTEDFACWASEHEMDEEPWRWMTAVARPEAIERYAARGWFRLPDDF